MSRKTNDERLEELRNRQPSVVVDWDGTCVEHVWPEKGDWLPGAVDALRALLEAGYRVQVHSCRLSSLDLDNKTPVSKDERFEEIVYVREMLDAAGLNEVDIIVEDDKPPAVAYIDDRGVRFDGDWRKAIAPLLGKPEPPLDFGPEWRATDPTTGGSKGRKQAVFANMSLVADVYEARVHGFGVMKYPDEAGAPNWSRGMPWSWFYDALRRHIAAFWAGENINHESGLPHLAHARWMISNLIEYLEYGLGTDDRPAWRNREASRD